MIFDLPVCDLDWDDALTFVNELASLPVGQTSISFVNAHNMLVMLRDETYRSVLERNLVLPDGIGLDIASRVAHGEPFPANLNGTDFVPALLTFMEKPKRIGLLGGKRSVVEQAAEKFRRHAPWHQFVVVSDGFFDPARSSVVTAEISRQKIDVLIVGMGTPLQEKWVAEHVGPQHARLVLTVGALFDFISRRCRGRQGSCARCAANGCSVWCWSRTGSGGVTCWAYRYSSIRLSGISSAARSASFARSRIRCRSGVLRRRIN